MDEIFFNDIIDKFPNEKLINFTNQINLHYKKYLIKNDTFYIYNKNNNNFSKFYKHIISSNRFKHQIKLFNLNVFCIVLINKRLNNIYFITGKNYINCLNLSLCFFCFKGFFLLSWVLVLVLVPGLLLQGCARLYLSFNTFCFYHLCVCSFCLCCFLYTFWLVLRTRINTGGFVLLLFCSLWLIVR